MTVVITHARILATLVPEDPLQSRIPEGVMFDVFGALQGERGPAGPSTVGPRGIPGVPGERGETVGVPKRILSLC